MTTLRPLGPLRDQWSRSGRDHLYGGNFEIFPEEVVTKWSRPLWNHSRPLVALNTPKAKHRYISTCKMRKLEIISINIFSD